eukprot:3078911-Amphidinium_carterae.1
MHIRAGREWSDELALTLRNAKRAGERGQGPPRQFVPLPLEAVAALPLTVDPLVPNGLVGGQNFI